MKTKTCGKCGINKPVEEFYTRKRGGYRSYCKQCYNEITKNTMQKWRQSESGKDFCKKHARKASSRYSQMLYRAKAKGFSVLAFEEYSKLIRQPCHYCGGNLPDAGYALDRKDSEKGYELENVVPCCAVCNKTKGDWFTYEEMLELGKVIRQIRENRDAFATQTDKEVTNNA